MRRTGWVCLAAFFAACGDRRVTGDPGLGTGPSMAPRRLRPSVAPPAGIVAWPPDAGFVEAAHSLPLVTDLGGPVLDRPVAVTITFANDPDRALDEALAGFLSTSTWLATVGPEYGVLGLDHLEVELPQDAPSRLSDLSAQRLLQSLLASGELPGGAPDGGVAPEYVYLLYVPKRTAFDVSGQPLCDVSSGGYHFELIGAGLDVPYAVLKACASPGATDGELLARAASHELIGAATDPYPFSNPAWRIFDLQNPYAYFGGEVGDLCENLSPQWQEGAFQKLQRVWSNAAAKAGGDPCRPAVGSYFGAGVSPATAVQAPAGSTIHFQLTGWSTAPVPDWKLSAHSFPLAGSFDGAPTLSRDTLADGDSADLTVTVPRGTPSGAMALIGVDSTQATGAPQPAVTTALALVIVP